VAQFRLTLDLLYLVPFSDPYLSAVSRIHCPHPLGQIPLHFACRLAKTMDSCNRGNDIVRGGGLVKGGKRRRNLLPVYRLLTGKKCGANALCGKFFMASEGEIAASEATPEISSDSTIIPQSLQLRREMASGLHFAKSDWNVSAGFKSAD
jgi:hypothetical protein